MKIRVFGTLRAAVDERKEVELLAGEHDTVGQMLEQLAAGYPTLGKKLAAQAGQSPANVTILVNGRSIDFLQGLATPVQEGDQIALFPPIGGG